jgi:hypothetical protein
MLPYFTVLIFGFRNPNMNLTEYKTHYEQTHIPLAKSIAGTAWPVSHTRHYFGGNQSLSAISYPVDWDSMAVMTFRDEKHAFTFQGLLGTPEAKEKIHGDEEIFMAEGSPHTVVIGWDGVVTVPDV